MGWLSKKPLIRRGRLDETRCRRYMGGESRVHRAAQQRNVAAVKELEGNLIGSTEPRSMVAGREDAMGEPMILLGWSQWARKEPSSHVIVVAKSDR